MHDSHVLLIITDEAAFPRDLVGRWQLERTVPAFTVMNTELFDRAAAGHFDLAIVGPVRNGRLASVLKAIDTGSHPVICVLESAQQVQAVKAERPRLLALQRHEVWLDSAVLLAIECLKRVDLAARVRRMEQAAAVQEPHAGLGRYMMENRHDFNNLLTSVLGNAELLMLDGNLLSETTRDQVETIHRMALHMHGIIQRFSSLAAEVQMVEKQSQDETQRPSHLTISAS